jgi:hypothetical protein
MQYQIDRYKGQRALLLLVRSLNPNSSKSGHIQILKYQNFCLTQCNLSLSVLVSTDNSTYDLYSLQVTYFSCCDISPFRRKLNFKVLMIRQAPYLVIVSF